MRIVELYSHTALTINDNVLTTLATIDLGDEARIPDRIAIFVNCPTVVLTPTSVDFTPLMLLDGGYEHPSVELTAYAASAAITNDGALQITPGLPDGYTPLFFPGSTSMELQYQGAGCDGANYFVCRVFVYAYYDVR